MGFLRRGLLWASTNPWLSRRLPRRRFVRRAVRRFMPGEELEDALGAAERLAGKGAASVLTLLGENVEGPDDAAGVAAAYREILDRAAERGLDAHVSVKPTHLGLDLGARLTAEHLDGLAGHAAERASFLWIDMESSAYVDATLALYRKLRERHEDVGVCLQAYLRRTPEDVEALLPLDPAIRLVKGAYLEPPELAFPRKAQVDAAYLRLATRLLEAAAERPADPPRVAIATHDGDLIDRVLERARAGGIPPSRYEFEMLYGIGRAEQERLVAAGERLRVLISYGDAWFPWYMRRLAERPANLWFVLRHLVTP